MQRLIVRISTDSRTLRHAILPRSMAERCRTVADSGAFQGFILVVIVLNAITLGLQTYDISSGLESALTTLDDVFLGIFVVELAIRIAAFGAGPQDFFKDGWNVFDFVVIARRVRARPARERHPAADRAPAAGRAPGHACCPTCGSCVRAMVALDPADRQPRRC